jgi:hypothetical protein
LPNWMQHCGQGLHRQTSSRLRDFRSAGLPVVREVGLPRRTDDSSSFGVASDGVTMLGVFLRSRKISAWILQNRKP